MITEPAMRASRNPEKDKLMDEMAVNLDLADDLERMALVLRSRNARLRALAHNTTPTARKSGPVVDADKAA